MKVYSLQKAVRFFLAAVFFLSAAASLQAYPRINATMVGDIRQADLIVFADISRRDGVLVKNADALYGERYIPPVLDIKILEVLKGDASFVEETITIPDEVIFDGPNVKVGQQIVLFVKDTNNNPFWMTDVKKGLRVLEGYKDESIPGFRCLADILRIKPEIAQARKIMDLIQNPKAVCPQADWVASNAINALYTLRDKKSFSVVEKALPNVSTEMQLRILEWMRATGDLRAVPVLLRYIDSPDRNVRREAIWGLIYDFPGAPGITKAFMDKWKTSPDDVRGSMIEYLYKRVSDPDVEKAYREQLKPKTSYVTFKDNLKEAFRDGLKAEAKKYCAQIVEDDSINDSARWLVMEFGAECFSTFISPEDQDKYIPLFADLLEKQGGVGDDDLRVALSAQHPALIRVLMAYLKKQNEASYYSSNQDELLSAVLAISEYGKDASDMAAKELLAQLREHMQENARIISMEKFWQIIALVWVGTDQDISAMWRIMEDGHMPKDYMQLAASMKPVSKIPDEAAFWIEMIKNRSKFPHNAVEWFVARLGLLQDERAIPVLMELLEDDKTIIEKPIYRALAKIGKSGIEQLESFALNLDSSSPRYREGVVDAICNSEKEAILPFLRQLFKSNKFDSRYVQPWMCFGDYGTVDDIAFLASYTDYWKYGGEGRYYWPRQAILKLREKYGYDITGRPIKKQK